MFRNRREAGRILAPRLQHLAGERPVVLALPRGGVPVAYEIARALHAELDLLLVRKLGAPGHEEVGIGAVVDGADPQIVLNEAVMRQIAPSPDYIRAEVMRQLRELERRRQLYRGDRKPPEVAGRTVIVVDDGIATGGTIRAALRGLRKSGPDRLVLAVPVSPREVAEQLSSECDELVCLLLPEPFHAVGAHYADFTQTTDAEVVELLKDADVSLSGASDQLRMPQHGLREEAHRRCHFHNEFRGVL